MLPKIETAVRELIKAAPEGPAKGVYGRLALRLAAALDGGGTGSTTANVARELRATIAALLPEREEASSELDEVLAGLRR